MSESNLKHLKYIKWFHNIQLDYPIIARVSVWFISEWGMYGTIINTIKRIAGKAGYRLGDNHIDSSASAFLYHFIKLFPLFGAGSTQVLVSPSQDFTKK